MLEFTINTLLQTIVVEQRSPVCSDISHALYIVIHAMVIACIETEFYELGGAHQFVVSHHALLLVQCNVYNQFRFFPFFSI